MQLHDKLHVLLLVINLISQVVLFSICWYRGLAVLFVLFVLCLGVDTFVLGVCVDFCYYLFGLPLQARFVNCTEYEGDGLDQQFLVEYDYYEAPCCHASLFAARHAPGAVAVAHATDKVKNWMFHPPCVKDFEYPNRAR